MTCFSYKPALLIGAVTYDLGDIGIVCTDKSGTEKWRLDWNDITGAAFVEHTVKGSRMRRLDLLCGADAPTRSISYTGPKGDPTRDPDSVAHLQLLVAILNQLGAGTPDFQVSVGEYGKSRVALFVIGIATLVGGLGIAGLWISTGVSGNKIADAAIPVVLLALMGVMLVWSNAPWRAVPRLSAVAFATALSALTGVETGVENDKS